jgi:hypothetical protein
MVAHIQRSLERTLLDELLDDEKPPRWYRRTLVRFIFPHLGFLKAAFNS